MNEEQQRRRRPGTTWIRLMPLLVLVAIVAIWAGWRYRDALFGPGGPDEAGSTDAGAESAGSAGETSGEAMDAVSAYSPLERQWRDATGWSPVWPEDLVNPSDCAAVVRDLRDLCSRLDGREYVREWNLPGGTFDLIVSSSRDLEGRRPVIEGELKRYGAILANVSHLFRILGEERLLHAAELAVLEPDLAEPMAMTLYRWMRVRERCGSGEPRAMSLKAQYDYSAFFLTTIGGQAYLRRRLPQQEVLATFYALLILDQAIESGYNPAGVDLRPDIARCRGMIERQDFVFGERYLGILDSMRRRWMTRSSLVGSSARGR